MVNDSCSPLGFKDSRNPLDSWSMIRVTRSVLVARSMIRVTRSVLVARSMIRFSAKIRHKNLLLTAVRDGRKEPLFLLVFRHR